MCSRILRVKLSHPLDKVLHAALLKDAHKGRPKSLGGIGGDLGDGGLGSSTLLHEAARDLLELEISGNVGGNEDIGKLAGGHEELGHQVDVPVVQPAILFPWLGVLGIVAILLEELERRQKLEAATGARGNRDRYGFEVDRGSITGNARKAVSARSQCLELAERTYPP